MTMTFNGITSIQTNVECPFSTTINYMHGYMNVTADYTGMYVHAKFTVS